MSLDIKVNSEETFEPNDLGKTDKFGNIIGIIEEENEVVKTDEEVYLSHIINSIRFYKNKLPDVNDYVLGKVLKYEELGLVVFLNEYQINAFLNYKDASHAKKIKNIEKELIVGKEYIFQVESIDIEKEYININRINVRKEEQSSEMSRIMTYRIILHIFISVWIKNNRIGGEKITDEDIGDFSKIINREKLESFLNETIYNIDIETIRKYFINWYDNEDKFNKYINRMFKEDKLTIEDYELKSQIIDRIKETFCLPSFDVIGKLMLSYNGKNAIDKLKKILNIINIDFSVDECYIQIPPNYELIWKNQSHMELFESFTVDRIKELIIENGENVDLFTINLEIQ
jgi:translation initiation factor 2 alpha subunit (eIF-2alpha)